MNKRDDFSFIEEEINRRIRNAVNYIDYSKDKIYDVKSTLQDIASSFKTGFNTNKREDNFNRTKYNNNNYQNSYNQYNSTNYNTPSYNQVSYINKKPAGRVSGILFLIFGIIGAIISSVALIGLSVATYVLNIFFDFNINLVFIILGVLLLTTIILIYRGNFLNKRINRFKRYSVFLEGRNFCKIELLSNSINKSNKYVIKDLRKMIKLGMFRNAHFDDEKTYFMLGDEIYEDYLKMKKGTEIKEDIKEENEDTEKTEVAKVIELRNKYISEISSANHAIKGKEISFKLDKLQYIVTEIFNYVESNTEKLQHVQRFINHYLPITIKLVNSYKELDNQIIEGENIKRAKEEIEQSLDLINKAFEKLLDELFADVVVDVSSDISVLKTLFSQEGLTEDEIKKNK